MLKNLLVAAGFIASAVGAQAAMPEASGAAAQSLLTHSSRSRCTAQGTLLLGAKGTLPFGAHTATRFAGSG